jgi:LacI family transcriptional regulator
MRPKYQEVADAIETHVRSGKWDGGRMPSVRGIAGQYSVSIVTASRALQVLRDKGLVQSVERSGTFRMAPATADHWAVVLRLTPGPYQRATTAQARGGFESLARRRPMHLHFDAFALDSGANDFATAARTAIANGIQGVFLLPSRADDAAGEADTAFVMACRDAGLPVVLLERSLRGDAGIEGCDLVALDGTAAAAECTRHLLQRSCKRVAIAVASPTSTHNDRIAGYLYAMHAARISKKDPADFVIRLPDESQSHAAAAYLADRVVKERIDGIVCYQDYVAMGLIIELLNRGVRVPGDVAVCGFDDIDIGNLFPAGLTTYAYPADALADHAVRLMLDRRSDPLRSPVRVVVPGRLVVRGSTVST